MFLVTIYNLLLSFKQYSLCKGKAQTLTHIISNCLIFSDSSTHRLMALIMKIDMLATKFSYKGNIYPLGTQLLITTALYTTQEYNTVLITYDCGH